MDPNEEIAAIKERLTHWERTRDEAEIEAQKCRKRLRELDTATAEARKRAAARKYMQAKIAKCDQIVHVLRQIGKTATATPICKMLEKYYGIKLHNSEFAGAYLGYIKDDTRIVIKNINPTKNEYSLKEWGER